MKAEEDKLATNIFLKANVFLTLNRKSNEWKQKKIKLATNVFLKDKYLGFLKWISNISGPNVPKPDKMYGLGLSTQLFLRLLVTHKNTVWMSF